MAKTCYQDLQYALEGGHYLDLSKKDDFDQVKYMRNAYNEANYTDPQKIDLDEYSGSQYVQVNQMLRGETLDASPERQKELKSIIKTMDQAIDKWQTKDPMYVYRGINISNTDGKKLLTPGAVITDKGFVSTTIDKEVAINFASNIKETDNWSNHMRLVSQIAVPKGTNAIILPSREKEIILDRNSSFRVIKSGHNTNGYWVNMVKL